MNIAFTICTNNYLPQAKTLSASFIKLHPDYTFFIVLADKPVPDKDYSFIQPVTLLPVSETDIADLNVLSEKFHVIEFCTALKPGAFKYFIKRFPTVEALFYFDPDLCFYSPIDEVGQQLGKDVDFLITPHILSPIPMDNHTPDETLFLNYGIYNLGFLGISAKGLQTTDFLNWWEARVLALGYDDVANGRFTDQLWINLLPLFFKRVKIIRHPGYNMAPWNLHERTLVENAKDEKPLLASGELLVFYHFSRYKFSEDTDAISFYNRVPLQKGTMLYRLYTGYKQQLFANRYAEWHAVACTYGKPALHIPVHRANTMKQQKKRTLSLMQKIKQRLMR